MSVGSGARVAEAYLPLRQCVEVLGAALAPAAVRSLLLECLNGIKCKADWQVRRQATETLASLAAAIQVHKQTAGGEWRLEPTQGVAVVASHKALVAAALADVKYDKIAVVREAAAKALTEMDCIPAPAPGPANPQPGVSNGRPQWHSAAQAQVPAAQPGERDPAPGQRRVPRRRWAPLGRVDANAEPWRADPAAKPSPAARHGGGALEWGAAEAAGLRAWGAPRLQEQVPPGEAAGCGGRAHAHGPGRGLQGSLMRQAFSAGERQSLDFGVQVFAKAPPPPSPASEVGRSPPAARPTAAEDELGPDEPLHAGAAAPPAFNRSGSLQGMASWAGFRARYVDWCAPEGVPGDADAPADASISGHSFRCTPASISAPEHAAPWGIPPQRTAWRRLPRPGDQQRQGLRGCSHPQGLVRMDPHGAHLQGQGCLSRQPPQPPPAQVQGKAHLAEAASAAGQHQEPSAPQALQGLQTRAPWYRQCWRSWQGRRARWRARQRLGRQPRPRCSSQARSNGRGLR